MTRAQLTAAQHAARHSRIAHLLRTTCSYCHAPAGEPCRSKSGTPSGKLPKCTMPASRPHRVNPLPPIRPARWA
jgi:hypothetical protein